MKQWNRIFFFLLLNIFISACTTLSVLYIWDQTRTQLPGGLISPPQINLTRPTEIPPATPTTASDRPDPTATPAVLFHPVKEGDTFESIALLYDVTVDDLVQANGFPGVQRLSPGELLRVPIRPVIISSVIGAGDLETEHVVIQSNSAGEISLAGWKLEDNAGNEYTFPDFKFFTKGQGINLYTKTGADTVSDLFWGQPLSIWLSGMVVTLRDAQGNVQSIYRIP
jgi:LysM repeat protein